MPLTATQKNAFDQSIPAIGTGDIDSAGAIIDQLLTQGPDDGALSLGDAASGSVAGKLNAVYVTYASNATANTADSVTHALGRTPVGYIVIRNGNGGVVYDGGAAFTDTTISLKCTTAGNTATLLVW